MFDAEALSLSYEQKPFKCYSKKRAQHTGNRLAKQAASWRSRALNDWKAERGGSAKSNACDSNLCNRHCICLQNADGKHHEGATGLVVKLVEGEYVGVEFVPDHLDLTYRITSNFHCLRLVVRYTEQQG